MVREATDKKKKPPGQTLCGQIFGKKCRKRRNAKKEKMSCRKPKLDNARRLRGIYFLGPKDEEFKDIMKTLVESWKFRCQQQCFVKLQ